MNFFIELLSDHLNRRQTVVPEDVNWGELVATAKKHEMAALLFFQCKDFVPDQYRSSLEQANIAAAFYYFNRINEEQQIRESLGKIRSFIIKGTSIAAYYPSPYLRTMGDSDIVVDESDMEKVHEIMLQRGYNSISVGNYKKDEMGIEIHTCLAFKTPYTTVADIQFFSNYWSYYHDNKIDWNFHFLYVMHHLRKHLTGSGVGFRQFADIAVLTKYNTELDWSWIEDKLKIVGMWSFAQRVFALNRYWFRIEPPIEVQEIDGIFLKEASEQILKNGVFGFDDLDNRANRIVVSRTKHPILFVFKRTIDILFPKYIFTKRMPQYTFLKGRPALLPVAWIYRGYYTIKHKGMRRVRTMIETSFTTQKAIDKRKAMFARWGLWDNKEDR